MNTCTVTLSLFTSLCLSSFSQFSMTQSVWFHFLSQFWSLSLVSSLFLSLPLCRSITSFCTRLWERPAMAVLLRGTTDMHELLHCYEFTNCSSSSKCLACACSASQQRGNAERMLHQRCGQDYLKNLLELILHFIISAHSAPHTDGLWSIVLRDLNEAISVWNMSLFSVPSSAFWYSL